MDVTTDASVLLEDETYFVVFDTKMASVMDQAFLTYTSSKIPCQNYDHAVSVTAAYNIGV